MDKKGNVNLTVIGLIGVGKSTTSEKLGIALQKAGKSNKVFEESVDKNGLLRLFYEDIQRYALSFQMFMFSSRLQNFAIFKNQGGDVDYIISDGHVLTDRYVFSEMLHENKMMSDEEFVCYEQSFEHWQQIVPLANPQYIFYLKVSPEIAFERIRIRKRPEEVGITLEYLKNLEAKYEEFISRPDIQPKVVTIDSSVLKDEVVDSIIEYLDFNEKSFYSSKK